MSASPVASPTPVADARYAVYLAFAPDHPLQRRASAWLGRDADTGAPLSQPSLPEVSEAETAALTRAPRRYGFHGTLRAPFTPRGPERAVFEAAQTIAAGRAPFPVRLQVAAPRNALGPFGALTLAAPSPDLQALHEAALEAMEPVRGPLSLRDTVRYAAIDPLGAAHVARWGYAPVRERFHFHMTLTGYLREAPARARVLTALSRHFEDLLAAPVAVDSVAVFHQPNRATPFTVARRFPFTG